MWMPNLYVNLMLVSVVGFNLMSPLLLASERTNSAKTNGPLPESQLDSAMQRQIADWIAGLDDDSFSHRHACQQMLVRTGWPVLRSVQEAMNSPSAEVRLRAKLIKVQVQHGWLNAEFSRIAQLKADEMDVEYAMWLIALIVNPAASRQRMTQQLDDLAAAVQRRIGPQTDARTLPPRQLMEALREELFAVQGFAGATNDYDHPQNSSLDYVLSKRRGLPILLSHVVVCVAQRLKAPVYGYAANRCYMVMYDHRQAPAKHPTDELIMHAFDGGRLMNRKELEETLNRLGTQLPANSPILPDAAPDIIRRMLANLASDYAAQGDPQNAAWVSGISQQFGTPLP